jgi:integrase
MARKKQKRRNNGEGTWRLRADGRAEIREDGRSYYGPGGDFQVAKEKRDAANALTGAGITLDAQTTTLGTYIDRWLEQNSPDWRPNTLHAYRHALGLAEPIRSLMLADVQPQTIKGLHTHLVKRGVSDAMRHKLHSKLKSVMREAVVDGLLPANPLDRMRGPRAPEAVVSYWTESQLLCFLRAIPEGDPAYAMFYVLAFTGLRRGELLGLHWNDFTTWSDGGGVLQVERSVVASRGSGFAVMPPKTDKSRRGVTITADVVDALQHHRSWVQAQRDSMGEMWHGTPAIFPSRVGTYSDPRNTNRLFDRWQEQAGVRRIRVHDLRHTHASILIANGYDAGVVADRLGHENVAFTLRRYRHLFARQRKGAAFGMSELVRAEQLDRPTMPTNQLPN